MIKTCHDKNMIKEPPHLPKQVHLGLHVRNEYERLISIFNYQTM